MDERGGFGQGVEGMVELAGADSGGAEDEGAVGDGGGEGGVFGGRGEDGGGVDGGFLGGLGVGVFCQECSSERGTEIVDDAEVREAEVVHGAGDGTDVGGVAGANEDDDDAGTVLGEHELMVAEWVGGDVPGGGKALGI